MTEPEGSDTKYGLSLFGRDTASKIYVYLSNSDVISLGSQFHL